MDRTKYLPVSWFDPRVELRESPIHGKGIFATAPIQADEVVAIWGGDVYAEAELSTLKLEGAWSTSMIEEGVLLFAPADAQDYFINHSCDPNLWMIDEVTLTARRDIAAGEEICGDFAVWESDPGYIIDPCQCGAAQCRGRYCGDDWRLPELQQRYRGHFLPFINRWISAQIYV